MDKSLENWKLKRYPCGSHNNITLWFLSFWSLIFDCDWINLTWSPGIDPHKQCNKGARHSKTELDSSPVYFAFEANPEFSTRMDRTERGSRARSWWTTCKTSAALVLLAGSTPNALCNPALYRFVPQMTFHSVQLVQFRIKWEKCQTDEARTLK